MKSMSSVTPSLHRQLQVMGLERKNNASLVPAITPIPLTRKLHLHPVGSWLFHFWTPGLFGGHADPHPFPALGGAEAVPYKVLTGLDVTHS